ncbi:MAG: hypothetical protein QNJ31_03520 [Candidatus Caenarcaniphilales bacterium]|nr:hypothetical protein [Candidatus Caenarcaniphilales bacterium]
MKVGPPKQHMLISDPNGLTTKESLEGYRKVKKELHRKRTLSLYNIEVDTQSHSLTDYRKAGATKQELKQIFQLSSVQEVNKQLILERQN